MIYRAEYADENFECFECDSDFEAINEATDLEKKHNHLLSIHEIDENYDEIRTVFKQEGETAVTEAIKELRVAGGTKSKMLAGCIAGIIRDTGQPPELLAVGAGAINQANKAVAIANGFLASSGIQLCVVPAFCNPDLKGKRCAMRLIVEFRR